MQIRQHNQYPEPSEKEAAVKGTPPSGDAQAANPAASSESDQPEAAQANAEAYGQDETHNSAGTAPSHEQPANQVQFERSGSSDAPTGSESSTSSSRATTSNKVDPLQQLQALFKEKRPVMDPAVLKLLDYVREMQDKNIQHMLDMMQQSLDRAREMMEKNEEYYYSETLPKLEALQSLVQQEQMKEKGLAAEAAQQEVRKVDGAQTRSDRLVAHKLQHLTREIQQMADREVPPNYAQLQTELQQALQLALIL